jgi:glycerophosphoryl diester phosphodiesterase
LRPCGAVVFNAIAAKTMRALLPLLLLPGSLPAAPPADPPPTPLPRAYSHNDYARPRPLLDALEQGFCSVEADVHLVDGELLIAHDRNRVKPEGTLQALYLDPLRERVKANGGRVYRDGPEFSLLIDFKSDAVASWAALRGLLNDYAPMLTRFRPDSTETNAVTIIISGNRPREALAAQPERFAALDGRLPDLEGAANRHLVPWISPAWYTLFGWRGNGPMPTEESAKLRQIVARAHQQGRKVRFWGGPDIPALWGEQLAAGVDLINTDKLAELRAYLTRK